MVTRILINRHSSANPQSINIARHSRIISRPSWLCQSEQASWLLHLLSGTMLWRQEDGSRILWRKFMDNISLLHCRLKRGTCQWVTEWQLGRICKRNYRQRLFWVRILEPSRGSPPIQQVTIQITIQRRQISETESSLYFCALKNWRRANVGAKSTCIRHTAVLW